MEGERKNISGRDGNTRNGSNSIPLNSIISISQESVPDCGDVDK